jgi:hypothetical protein
MSISAIINRKPPVISVSGHVTVEEVPTIKDSKMADRFKGIVHFITVLTAKAKTSNEVNRTPIPEDLKPEKNETIKVTGVSFNGGGNKRKRVPDANDKSNPWLNLTTDAKESRLSKKQKKDIEDEETELKVHDLKTTTASTTSSAFDEVKKQAFASDDLSLQFESEKQRAMENEIQLPEMESAVLPGWGNWVGKGTNWKQDVERKKKSIQRIKKKMMDEKVRERVDSDIGHVIIRETAKIPDKYLNKNVSHDNVLSKIHDRSMTHPLGPEWNSLTGHLEATQPRIKTKRGTRIAPLDYEEARREVQWRRVADVRDLNGDVTRREVEKELEKPVSKLELEAKKKPKMKVDKDRKLKEERSRIVTEIDHSVDVLVDR